MIFPSVDLPAPFSPTRAWISAASIASDTSDNACVLPKRLLTLCSVTMGGPIAAVTTRPFPGRLYHDPAAPRPGGRRTNARQVRLPSSVFRLVCREAHVLQAWECHPLHWPLKVGWLAKACL